MTALLVWFLLMWSSGEDRYRQAVTWFQQGRFMAALESLDQLPEAEAHRPAAQNLRSLVLMKLRKFEAALQANTEASKLDPENPNYIYNRGLIQLASGSYQQAEQTFREASRRFPRSHRLYLGLGEALFEMHRYREAEAALKTAAQLEPASGEAQAALAKLYYALGDQASFATAAQTAIRAEPQNHLACYFYGKYLLESAGRREEGREYIAKSVKLAPDFEDGLIEWGEIMSREGRWTEATQALEQAALSNPARAQTRYLMYVAYRKSGRPDKARQALLEYQKLNSHEAP